MSAPYNGTTIILDVGGNPLLLLTDTTLNIEQDLPDASHKGSQGWADHIHGQRSWTIDVDGWADLAHGANIETIWDSIDDREAVSIEFAPDESGAIKFTGSASASSLSIGAPNEDTATASGSLTGKGPLTKETVS